MAESKYMFPDGRIMTMGEYNSEQEQQDISQLTNFNKNYGDFNYQKNNPYLQAMTRAYGGQVDQAGQQMAVAQAARGTSDSGDVNRNIARMRQAQGQNLQQLSAQDYMRQYNDFLNNRSTAYQQKLTGLNLSLDSKQRALDSYYRQLAEDKANAEAEYNQEWEGKQKNIGMWDVAGEFLGMVNPMLGKAAKTIGRAVNR